MSEFMRRIDRLYKISKLGTATVHPFYSFAYLAERFDAQRAVKNLIAERENSTKFDTTWLEHLGQRFSALS